MKIPPEPHPNRLELEEGEAPTHTANRAPQSISLETSRPDLVPVFPLSC